jgi:hypothetical protein
MGTAHGAWVKRVRENHVKERNKTPLRRTPSCSLFMSTFLRATISPVALFWPLNTSLGCREAKPDLSNNFWGQILPTKRTQRCPRPLGQFACRPRPPGTAQTAAQVLVQGSGPGWCGPTPPLAPTDSPPFSNGHKKIIHPHTQRGSTGVRVHQRCRVR